jgi:hypothetical protein
MEGSYGIHSFNFYGYPYIEEGTFINELLSGYGKQTIGNDQTSMGYWKDG